MAHAGDVMANPVPDIAYYDTGAVRYRGFRLDGEMHAGIGGQRRATNTYSRLSSANGSPANPP